jgi:radical SAM superfamily enzyme YgiQ (UPF0313 family)
MTPGLREPGAILLVSCYELGHAPHGIALPAAFLRRAGFAPAALDLAVEPVDQARLAPAQLIVVSVPMHTALRVALDELPRLRALAPAAAIGFTGAYAVLHAAMLRALGAAFTLAGEFEETLVDIARALDRGQPLPHEVAVPLERLRFPPPDRSGLAHEYARLLAAHGEERPAGYTEASRGCLDTCRHCPVPAVHGGRFFVVDRETVLADVEAQVAAGARHITFGDPDFLNGPGHALAIARELHRRFPGVSFDVTAQVSHLLRQRAELAELAALGCAFVTTAVESLSDRVLAALGKRHRRADLVRLLDLAEEAGLVVRPTFVPFTPWTEIADLVDLVELVAARDLWDRVAPVQLSIRLLVPPGSLLLASEHRDAFGELDPAALGHTWSHPLDDLQRAIADRVDRDARDGRDPVSTLSAVRDRVRAAAGLPPAGPPPHLRRSPRLSEPWFC